MICASIRLMLAAYLLAPLAASAAMDFEDLRDLVQKENLRSVEAVIERLPDDLRQGFTLMHRSRSLQGASATHPRAILFGSTGELILSFNGHPQQTAYDSIEVLEFLPSEARFRMHDIAFVRGGAAPARFSAPNPAKCLTCHGADPRPIWNGYNLWPGAYGSFDDALDPNPSCDAEGCIGSEEARFMEFKSKLALNRRFASLKWRPGAWPYYLRRDENRKLSLMPNTRLSVLSAYHQARSAARQLQALPLYRRLRSGVLHAAVCDSLFVADALMKRLKACAPIPKGEFWLSSRAQWIGEVERPKPDMTPRENLRASLLNLIGLPLGSTSLDLRTERGAQMNAAIPNGLWDAGADSYLALQLLRLLAADDVLVASALEKAKAGFPQYDYQVGREFADYLASAFVKGPILRAEICSHLEARAWRELAAYESVEPVCRPADLGPPVDSSEWRIEAGRKVFAAARCANCHDPSSVSRVGPEIPFLSQEAFADFVESTAAQGNSILERIELRVSDRVAADRRMPMAVRSLTRDEQEWLMAYLQAYGARAESRGSR